MGGLNEKDSEIKLIASNGDMNNRLNLDLKQHLQDDDFNPDVSVYESHSIFPNFVPNLDDSEAYQQDNETIDKLTDDMDNNADTVESMEAVGGLIRLDFTSLSDDHREMVRNNQGRILLKTALAKMVMSWKMCNKISCIEVVGNSSDFGLSTLMVRMCKYKIFHVDPTDHSITYTNNIIMRPVLNQLTAATHRMRAASF